MAGHIVRYDRERVAVLHQRARAAADDLASIVSNDPAAAAAVGVVAGVRCRLEQQWLPLLARVLADDAMATWMPTAVVGVVGRWSAVLSLFGTQQGAELGGALADTAHAVIGDGDVDDIIDLAASLERFAGDVVAMRTFFTELGGDGVAELMMALGTDVEHAAEALALAAVVRTRLAEASTRAGFPAAVAPAMVGGFADAATDDRRNPAAAMAYLFDDMTYGTEFLVATTRTLVERELDEGSAGAPELDALLWPGTIGLIPGSVLNRELDDRDDGNWSSELLRGNDPMYVLLETIATNGSAGRSLFSDHRVAGDLFEHRQFQLDGLRSLAAAAENAAAGPDVVVGAHPDTLAAAATVASAFVNHVGRRDTDLLWEFYANDAVSLSAATILGQHIFAVHNAVLVPERLDEPRGDLVEIADQTRGDGTIASGALFDEEALGVITGLAVDTTDGVATMRAALDLHQQMQATLGVGRIANGEIADVNTFLREAVADAARLEAYMVARAGHRAESNGRAVDDVIGLWIDLGSLSIGVGNRQFQRDGGSAGRLTAPVIGEFLGPAADLARSLFMNHETAVERQATEQAEAAADQLTYVWHRQLYGQGVVTPDLPDRVLAGDELVGWEEFGQLDAALRQLVRNRLEETTGAGGVNIDGNALRDVVKVQQLPIYQQLD